jgi:hypothetical protein
MMRRDGKMRGLDQQINAWNWLVNFCLQGGFNWKWACDLAKWKLVFRLNGRLKVTNLFPMFVTLAVRPILEADLFSGICKNAFHIFRLDDS